MKKFLSLLTAWQTAGALLVGCGGAQPSVNQKSGINFELMSVESEGISVTDSYFVDESLHVDKK